MTAVPIEPAAFAQCFSQGGPFLAPRHASWPCGRNVQFASPPCLEGPLLRTLSRISGVRTGD